MNDFLYMLGIVAAGFALNFGLRAVPFLIFGSRKGDLPRWVSRFGDFVSPVIIAGLIVYSYSGMQWKTLWPYLAGAVTVGLQLWKRNPLASIVVGTVLYMCFLNCGCASQRVLSLDMENPSIHVTVEGVRLDDQLVTVREVAEILEDNDIPKARTIHILLEPDVKDLRLAQALMAYLAKEGYKRPVLVTQRHAVSFTTGKKRSSVSPITKTSAPKKIRYKKATE